MSNRYRNKQQFVIMPSFGIAGKAMEASIFQSKTSDALSDALRQRIGVFSEAKAGIAAFAPSAQAELTKEIDPNDFEVISQRFSDGPATVSMSHAARLAIQASNPDLRVFPVTRYYVPGTRPGTRAKAAEAASDPAGESAMGADRTVFVDDLKQYFLKGNDGGAKGKGVLVGVIDTGIDGAHPALKGQISALRCYIPGVAANSGGPVNWGPNERGRSGHGTHVAGIIAAAPGFGGPAGMAPQARLIGYRVFPDSASGPKGATNPVIIDSIRAAIDDGCHIVNLSIEGAPKEDGVRSAVEHAWQNGVLCVAAAGNGFGNPVGFPAAIQHCIAVTAIGRDGSFPNKSNFTRFVSDQRATSDPAIFLASFSNYGPQVQFTAPGHAIVSTFPGNEWWFDSGTSMAAPFITGLLARLLSDNGNVLNMPGNAQRSSAMLQMLVGRARVLGLPQVSQEGYGLPV